MERSYAHDVAMLSAYTFMMTVPYNFLQSIHKTNMTMQTRNNTSTTYSGSWNYGSKSCKSNQNIVVIFLYWYICRIKI